MNDKELFNLLQRADAGSQVRATNAGDLATRALRVATLRRRRRAIAAGIIPVVFISGLIGVKHFLQPSERPASPVARKEQVQTDVKMPPPPMDMVAAAWLGKLQTQRHVSVPVPAGAGSQLISDESEKAAGTIVAFANFSAADPAKRDDAIRQYQNVIDYFPKTSWAEVARRQLEQFRSHGT